MMVYTQTCSCWHWRQQPGVPWHGSIWQRPRKQWQNPCWEPNVPTYTSTSQHAQCYMQQWQGSSWYMGAPNVSLTNTSKFTYTWKLHKFLITDQQLWTTHFPSQTSLQKGLAVITRNLSREKRKKKTWQQKILHRTILKSLALLLLIYFSFLFRILFYRLFI